MWAGALLVVTGSRVLEDREASFGWGTDLLADALGVRRWSYVIHGGARGPDTWSGGMARERGIGVVSYELDGTVRINGTRVRRWSVATWNHPLERNREIHRRTTGLVPDFEVYVLGLRVPWSKTDGTMHTCTLFMKSGVPTWVATCPAELGPKQRSAT